MRLNRTRAAWAFAISILQAFLPATSIAAREAGDVARALGTATPGIASSPTDHLFSRADLLYGLTVVGLTAAVMPSDVRLTEEATESRSRGERRLAGFAQPLGNGAVVAAALGASYLAAYAAHRPAAERGILRVGGSVAVAGVSTLVLKESVGRVRPSSLPNDSDELKPFSQNASFPSGHAAVAFALATAVSEETHARWAPWVLYALAAVVGWSRVHDQRHWTSDVLAGAALGIWTARKTEAAWSREQSRREAEE